ncbi:MAG: hypothetical protein NTV93_12345 [Verrucomicrobia bacterium]|nr:hypothetical protein [Verrucomicrobiota bacterium]
MSQLLNDGSNDAPKLRVYLNLYNLEALSADSVFPSPLAGLERFDQLAADGFEGVQLTDDGPVPSGLRLSHCGLDRINLPVEADAIASKHVSRGNQCLTVHAGWGIEEDDEIFRLVEAILTASEKHRLPIFIETHRATITQDMWRTVQITKRFPEVRFNGDFSHYYCGQEMVYGGMAMKLAFMEPIFARIGFMHGRIANPGSMQVPIAAPPHFSKAAGEEVLSHFRKMWTLAMRGFLCMASPGDVLIFAPELLSAQYYYARLFPDSTGAIVEESDRYAQALLYRDLARSCFVEASNSLA